MFFSNQQKQRSTHGGRLEPERSLTLSAVTTCKADTPRTAGLPTTVEKGGAKWNLQTFRFLSRDQLPLRWDIIYSHKQPVTVRTQLQRWNLLLDTSVTKTKKCEFSCTTRRCRTATTRKRVTIGAARLAFGIIIFFLVSFGT